MSPALQMENWMKTHMPGVEELVPRKKYRVRAQLRDETTGRMREIDRVIQAKSAAEAAARRALLIAEAKSAPRVVEAPSEPAIDLPTLSQFAHSWMHSKLRAGELKVSTRATYATALDKKILPELGHLRIDEIRKSDLMDWRDRQVGSPATVNGRSRVLRTVLRAAVDRYELARDPSSALKALRDGGPKRRKALTTDELERLLDAVKVGSPKWYPVVLVLARTGCRFGEATALQWSDVDFELETITIQRAQWHGHVATTKTGTVRVAYLPPDLAAVLKAYRQEQVRKQRPELTEGWLFMTRPRQLDATKPKERRHLQSSSLRTHLAKAAKAAGIELHVHPHMLRHSANNALRRHDPQGHVTRATIGHSSAEMTAHYSHVDLEEKRELVRRAMPRAFEVGVKQGTEPGTTPEKKKAP